MCFLKQIEPLMGTALYLEYEDVISRSQIFKKCLLRLDERHRLFDDFLSVCKWIRVYYSWRPNRKDEGDNHLVELAVAGGADIIITDNIKDFKNSELSFPSISILTPIQFLETK